MHITWNCSPFLREDNFQALQEINMNVLYPPPVARYQILGELRTVNFVLVGNCGILKQANSACILEPSYWFKSAENEMRTSYWNVLWYTWILFQEE